VEKKVSKEILKKNSAESVFDDDKMGFQGKENILKLFFRKKYEVADLLRRGSCSDL